MVRSTTGTETKTTTRTKSKTTTPKATTGTKKNTTKNADEKVMKKMETVKEKELVVVKETEIKESIQEEIQEQALLAIVDTKTDELSNTEGVQQEFKTDDEPKPVDIAPASTLKNVFNMDEAIKKYKKTRLKKARAEYTIKNLFEREEGELRFDLIIQRNEVWDLNQKSNLIRSILYGYPIPAVTVEERGDDRLWFLDGKQRLTSILSFLRGEYALSKSVKDVYGIPIAKCKFMDLHVKLRNIIYDNLIEMNVITNLTDSERDEMFVNWNSGTPLKPIELTRAMYSNLIEQVNKISNTIFFSEDICMTKGNKTKFVDQEIIYQTAMLLDKGKENIKGFGNDHIRAYTMELKKEERLLSDEIMKKMVDTSSYLHEAISSFDKEDRKKIFKKIHTTPIFYVASKAKDEIKADTFGEFVRVFYLEEYDKNSIYALTTSASSTKRTHVLNRLGEIENAFDMFSKELEANPNETAKSIELFQSKYKNYIKEQK